MPRSAELGAAIVDALEAHRLPVTPAGLARLLSWATEAQKHGRRTNLIGMFEPRRIAEELVADSLMLLPLLDEHAPAAIVDVGAGAGVPGLILAGALDLPAFLVEPRAKRTMFLRHAARTMQLSTPAQVFEARLEQVPASSLAGAPPRLWVSRAVFAPERWLEVATERGQSGDLIALWCNGDPEPALLRDAPARALIGQQNYALAGPGPRSVLLYRIR